MNDKKGNQGKQNNQKDEAVSCNAVFIKEYRCK